MGNYKAKNHIYGVTGYNIRKDKIGTYIMPEYANYGGNYQAKAFK